MTSPKLSHTVPALVAFYAAGAAWAVADGITSLGPAIANGSRLNAPLVIIAAQVLGTLLALRSSGRRAIAGAALVLLACTASLAAVALDGDVGHAGLSGAQVAFQIAIAATTALTWVAAAVRVAAARRPAAVVAPANVNGLH
jgi:hypothetical protein